MTLNDTILAFLAHVLLEAEKRRTILSKLGYDSNIRKQISFLQTVFSGGNYDHKRLHDIDVGLVGLREFEQHDPAFADLLMVVGYIASQKAKGLRVDQDVVEKYLPHDGLTP